MKAYLDMTDEERRAFRTVPMRDSVVTRPAGHSGAGTNHLAVSSQTTHLPYSRNVKGARGSIGTQWSVAHHRRTALGPEYYGDPSAFD